MTNMVSFRSKHPKQELQRRFGNVSERLNELIERELTKPRPRDWRKVLERPRPKLSDEDYSACLTPE